MTKKELMNLEKSSDFIKAIKSFGYCESIKNGGSHRVFKCPGKPVLSVVDHGHSTISIGTRRNIANLIFNS